MNARSSKPRTLSGHRSTFAKRMLAGSRSTEAWIRFLPTPVRPSRRTRSLTRSGTARRLLQGAYVRPRVAQARRPPDDEHDDVRDEADAGGRDPSDDEPRQAED